MGCNPIVNYHCQMGISVMGFAEHFGLSLTLPLKVKNPKIPKKPGGILRNSKEFSKGGKEPKILKMTTITFRVFPRSTLALLAA